MDIREKANKMIDACELVVLTSVSDLGYPRPCVLNKQQSDGAAGFYVATGMNGVKTGHFKADPKAGACFYAGCNSVTLRGSVKIVEDAALKRAIWKDDFINHFPGGVEDPNYALLRFDADEATIWIDNEFETIQI